jgi:hypothetical protein
MNTPDALWLNVQGQPLTGDGVRQMGQAIAVGSSIRSF